MHKPPHRIKKYLSVISLCLSWALLPTVSQASLQKDIQQVLKKHGLDQGKVSIQAIELQQGKTLYQHDAHRILNPASTMKLLTSIAAFETFGSQHRFSTAIYGNKKASSGELEQLWIKGYGSPVLVSEELSWMAQSLKKQGIRAVKGPLFIDDSYFEAENPIRFPGKTGKSVYRIVTSALSYNFNVPESLIYAGKRIDKTNPKSARSPLIDNKIMDPSYYTARAIKQSLAQQNISVSGPIKFQAVPPTAELLLLHDSQKLSQIVAALNKYSNNYIAEQLLRLLGVAQFGQGRSKAGLAVLSKTLKKVGVSKHNYRLDNGSGLSRKNRLSAAQLTRLLQHALNSSYGEDLVRSLSIAGVDGTLRRRFQSSPLRGKIWAKTGTLYQVSALAGFMLVNKQPVVFAILANGFDVGIPQVERAQQAILERIARELKS